jgi:hypothetical protein
MSQIVEPKVYQGKDLETIFFRPMLSGASAEALGIRVLYNMPIPTVLNFWKGASNVLQPYTAGWSGGIKSEKFQKTLQMHKVKSEMSYTATDYFTMVYERVAAGPDANLDDLSGTILEEAETRLFRESLAASLRTTMWIGSTARTNGYYSTFDGILRQLTIDAEGVPQVSSVTFTDAEMDDPEGGEILLKKVWDAATDELRELKGDGQLAFFVTSDVYSRYEESLDSSTLEAAYIARQQGRTSLSFRGIPVVDMQVSSQLTGATDLPGTWAVLADKRNLAMAVNTADFPGTEVRMWYNADEMQNRQRAIFAVGCDYLLPELVCFGYKE